MKTSSVLSIDEQLHVFLDAWQSVRVALVEKHRLAAERYKHQPTMQLCYDTALRSMEHYQHEVDMLVELRKRALPVDVASLACADCGIYIGRVDPVVTPSTRIPGLCVDCAARRLRKEPKEANENAP